MLELKDIHKSVDGEIHVQAINATFDSADINLLLGPTRSGKTTLMRLLAGLETPDLGAVFLDGVDITRLPVQKRNTAMVYQQFINYPSLNVYENIASPLRIAKTPRSDIKRRVGEAAEILKLSPFLHRMPSELSGGQQQRVAIARALVKNARIVLLDEPLANLDYKLREELREELPDYFASRDAILIYATTEPTEALMLGGQLALLHEGRIIQAGATQTVFSTPNSLKCAQLFSDPPLNTLPSSVQSGTLFAGNTGISFDMRDSNLSAGSYILGLRPHHLRLHRTHADEIELQGKVIVNEITGSESFLHIEIANTNWIALATGISTAAPEQTIRCYINPEDFFLFNEAGDIARLPNSQGIV